MDLKVMNKAIAISETLFDDFDERPVDCDFVLPDYCPDIAAVLKCTLKPVIQSKQLSGDRMIVDGMAMIRVMYLDEGRKCVRCCEFSQPFTSNFVVKNVGVNACVQVSAKTDYVNCRATSPRRLDIHGAFTVKLKITAEGGSEIVSDIRGDKLYTRKNTVYYSVPAASAEKPFTISEVLELGMGKAPAEALIRGDAVANLTECKLLANKIIIKGELLLKNLYVSDIAAGTMEQVKHEIPFSQIIDVDGLNDEWECDVDLDVISSDIHISVNQNGESCLLSVNIKIMAMVQCYRTGGSEVVTDAYSAYCPLKMENKRLDTMHLLGIRRDTAVIKESLELPPEGIAEIVDIWCEATPTAQRCLDGKGYVDGKLMICMLAKDNAGVVSYYERSGNFTLEFDECCQEMSANVQVLQVDYTMAGDKIELRIEVAVSRRCYMQDSCQAVTSVTAEENASFPEEKAALKIYFAGGGESLWEIAKNCHTSIEAVMEENGLQSDVLPDDTMLLVPLC